MYTASGRDWRESWDENRGNSFQGDRCFWSLTSAGVLLLHNNRYLCHPLKLVLDRGIGDHLLFRHNRKDMEFEVTRCHVTDKLSFTRYHPAQASPASESNARRKSTWHNSDPKLTCICAGSRHFHILICQLTPKVTRSLAKRAFVSCNTR